MKSALAVVMLVAWAAAGANAATAKHKTDNAGQNATTSSTATKSNAGQRPSRGTRATTSEPMVNRYDPVGKD